MVTPEQRAKFEAALAGETVLVADATVPPKKETWWGGLWRDITGWFKSAWDWAKSLFQRGQVKAKVIGKETAEGGRQGYAWLRESVGGMWNWTRETLPTMAKRAWNDTKIFAATAAGYVMWGGGNVLRVLGAAETWMWLLHAFRAGLIAYVSLWVWGLLRSGFMRMVWTGQWLARGRRKGTGKTRREFIAPKARARYLKRREAKIEFLDKVAVMVVDKGAMMSDAGPELTEEEKMAHHGWGAGMDLTDPWAIKNDPRMDDYSSPLAEVLERHNKRADYVADKGDDDDIAFWTGRIHFLEAFMKDDGTEAVEILPGNAPLEEIYKDWKKTQAPLPRDKQLKKMQFHAGLVAERKVLRDLIAKRQDDIDSAKGGN